MSALLRALHWRRWGWWLLAVLLLVAPAMVGWAARAEGAPPREYRTVSIPTEGYALAGLLSSGADPGGPWVILVHGNRPEGQAHPLYEALRQGLRPEATVLALDLRGFGASAAGEPEEDAPLLDRRGDIEAAAAYLQTLGASEAGIVLVGHSLGSLQVLKAGQTGNYGLVIALGPAEFSSFLATADRRTDYALKFQRASGLPLTAARLAEEGKAFTPAGLFAPCPRSPILLVFGQFDLQESLEEDRPFVESACGDQVRWETVPLADHMYHTEPNRLPGLLRQWVGRWTRRALLDLVNDSVGAVDKPGTGP